MVNYKELGLVNSRDMFTKAVKGGYAIPAFNFNNMEQMQAIIEEIKREYDLNTHECEIEKKGK